MISISFLCNSSLTSNYGCPKVLLFESIEPISFLTCSVFKNYLLGVFVYIYFDYS